MRSHLVNRRCLQTVKNIPREFPKASDPPPNPRRPPDPTVAELAAVWRAAPQGDHVRRPPRVLSGSAGAHSVDPSDPLFMKPSPLPKDLLGSSRKGPAEQMFSIRGFFMCHFLVIVPILSQPHHLRKFILKPPSHQNF